jgi:uncharacterized protein
VLRASFRHLAGLGGLRERQLWLREIRTWDDVPAEGHLVSPRLDAALRAGLRESRERLEQGDFGWFARRLPAGEQWRLLPHVLEGAGCLDIETQALAPGQPAADEVTVIGVLDAAGARAFLSGRDLAAFPARAAGWSALLTFNGLAFDLPILRRAFPAWDPPACHVDLYVLLRRLGEKGGLKQIEPRLGLVRPPHLAHLSGADAAALWQARQRGDSAALRRLVEYCLTDAAHLKTLAELAYNRMLRRTGMAGAPLPVSGRGAVLYELSKALDAACGPAPLG